MLYGDTGVYAGVKKGAYSLSYQNELTMRPMEMSHFFSDFKNLLYAYKQTPSMAIREALQFCADINCAKTKLKN